ncbi:MAG: hypothetical protein H7338_18675 [Candidatus Sericytochromatia bacterium]|nr:hypothetical protein [Candidatus Sericytochromatia bacterium]
MAQERSLPVAAPLAVRLSPALGLADHWYVLRPAMQVGSGPVAVAICGRTVQLWRTVGGAVTSDDPDLRLCEVDDYVGAYIGHGEPAASPRLPDPVRAGCLRELRTIWMPADHRLVLENSLDFAHSAFVHPWSQPSWLLHLRSGLPALQTTYRTDAGGLSVRARWGRYTMFDHYFSLPDRLRLIVLPDSPWPLDVIVHHVPETADRSRMEVLVRRPAWPWESGGARFRTGDLLVLAVVSQQRNTTVRRTPTRSSSAVCWRRPLQVSLGPISVPPSARS